MITGIYQIRNKRNTKLYIGSCADINYGGIQHRWTKHRNDLAQNRHHSIKLQRAWNKYGSDVFIFEILEYCNPDICIEREQYYLDTLLFASNNDNRFDKLGYNICRMAGSTLGYHHTDNAKKKVSMANKGRKHSRDVCIKMTNTRIELGSQRGEKNGLAKLTEIQVKDIRRLIINQKTPYSLSQLADVFGVSISTISDIKKFRTWRHL